MFNKGVHKNFLRSGEIFVEDSASDCTQENEDHIHREIFYPSYEFKEEAHDA